MGFRFRFLVLLVPAVLAVWGALFFDSLRRSEATILDNLHRQGFEHGLTQSREFQVLMESCRRSAKGLSLALEQLDRLTDADIARYQSRLLEENSHVYGTTVALLPEATPRRRFAQYVVRSGDGRLQTRQLDDATYNYTGWGWFREPLEARSGVWSDPYFDEGGGNIHMTTYSTPIWTRGRLAGVATVDVDMSYLNSRLERLAQGRGSLSFLITENRRIIGPGSFGLRSALGLDEQGMDAKAFLPGLAALLTRPASHLARLPHPYSGRMSWVLAIPFTLTQGTSQVWTLVAVFPEEEMLRDLTRLRTRAFVLVALGLVLLAGILAWTLMGLARPIERLVAQAERYSEGNYSDTLDQGRGFREIRSLSAAFNHLGHSILEQLEAVRLSTVQKEKYRSELQFAADIQDRILPKVFPPFPDLVGLMDLHGLACPAREMGGDFFDFIRLGPDRIALVVADVSDKGAGSALFAAMTRTVLRELLASGLPPQEAMRRANLKLFQQNPYDMFVTALLVDYHPATGEGRLVAAGHDAPLVRGRDGSVQALPVGRAVPLAALEDTRFEAVPFRLAPEEVLLLFTDGVTEAATGEGVLFGLAGLKAALEAAAGQGCRALAERLLAEVRGFQTGGELADDVTLVALRCLARGPGTGADPTGRTFLLELPQETAALPLLAGFGQMLSREAGLDDRAEHHIQLALEETAMNLVMHGGQQGARFQVRGTVLPGQLRMEVLDTGRPFAFEEASQAYAGTPSSEGPVGGVGLFLIRKMMDEVRYEPGTLEGNRLVLIKRRAAAADSP